jgi:HJR/Mrr/RecB family endonuclease
MFGLSLIIGALTAAVICYVLLSKERGRSPSWTAGERESVANASGELAPGAGMSADRLERYCAMQLERAGWQVRRTAQYRAHGVDMIAQRDGLIVAIQCNKGWARADDASVERLAAGMPLAAAEYGVIVSNASFTPEAQKLAAHRGIMLMHYTELAIFDPALET